MHSNPNHFSGQTGSSATEYVLVHEPSEGAFNLQVPKGWPHQVYLHRPYGLNRPIISANSPDGQTAIFLGDPNIPHFIEPGSALDTSSWMPNFNPMQRTLPYVPADRFFTDYVQQRFGNMPGFRPVKMAANPQYQQIVEASSRRLGVNFHSTTISLYFDYTTNGQTWHGMINGCCTHTGSLWLAEVYGITSTGDPEQHHELALTMVTSLRFNPQWQQNYQQQQRMQHEQTMANLRTNEQILQSNHQQNMANIRMQGQAHQARMQNLHDSFDAHNQQWRDQQASIDQQYDQYRHSQQSNDYQHERNINAIREVHTVMDGQGNTFEVDNKHERYFVNKLDNTYIGADQATDLQELGRKLGIDIRNYEEVKILK